MTKNWMNPVEQSCAVNHLFPEYFLLFRYDLIQFNQSLNKFSGTIFTHREWSSKRVPSISGWYLSVRDFWLMPPKRRKANHFLYMFYPSVQTLWRTMQFCKTSMQGSRCWTTLPRRLEKLNGRFQSEKSNAMIQNTQEKYLTGKIKTYTVRSIKERTTE